MPVQVGLEKAVPCAGCGGSIGFVGVKLVATPDDQTAARFVYACPDWCAWVLVASDKTCPPGKESADRRERAVKEWHAEQVELAKRMNAKNG